MDGTRRSWSVKRTQCVLREISMSGTQVCSGEEDDKLNDASTPSSLPSLLNTCSA